MNSQPRRVSWDSWPTSTGVLALLVGHEAVLVAAQAGVVQLMAAVRRPVVVEPSHRLGSVPDRRRQMTAIGN